MRYPECPDYLVETVKIAEVLYAYQFKMHLSAGNRWLQIIIVDKKQNNSIKGKQWNEDDIEGK